MTSITIPEARFSFVGKFNSSVFSVRQDINAVLFKKLNKLLKSAEAKYTTYKPIYSKTLNDRNYITLSVKGCEKFERLTDKHKGNIYKLRISFTEAQSNGKRYLNIWCNELKLVSEFKEDRGTAITL